MILEFNASLIMADNSNIYLLFPKRGTLKLVLMVSRYKIYFKRKNQF